MRYIIRDFDDFLLAQPHGFFQHIMARKLYMYVDLNGELSPVAHNGTACSHCVYAENQENQNPNGTGVITVHAKS